MRGQLDGKQIAANSMPRSRIVQSDVQPVFSVPAHNLGFCPLPPLVGGSTFTPAQNVIYALYLGRTQKQVSLQFLEMWWTTGTTGTYEFGVLSTPQAGGKGLAQTLTKIVSTTSLTSQSGAGAKRNATAFNINVSPDTHLWGAFRTPAAAVSSPNILAMSFDWTNGLLLTVPSPSTTLASASSWSGATVAPSITGQGPYMRLLCA